MNNANLFLNPTAREFQPSPGPQAPTPASSPVVMRPATTPPPMNPCKPYSVVNQENANPQFTPPPPPQGIWNSCLYPHMVYTHVPPKTPAEWSFYYFHDNMRLQRREFYRQQNIRWWFPL